MKKLDIKSLIILLIFLLGIALSVYLVLNYQTILSRATSDDYTYFEVKNAQGSPLIKKTEGCEQETCGPGDYETESPEVKFEIKYLERLEGEDYFQLFKTEDY